MMKKQKKGEKQKTESIWDMCVRNIRDARALFDGLQTIIS
jgi:hypothetical protein